MEHSISQFSQMMAHVRAWVGLENPPQSAAGTAADGNGDAGLFRGHHRGAPSEVNRSAKSGVMVWIDDVGAWQVVPGGKATIGAPSFESESAEITLQANISRRHATLRLDGEHWFIDAHQPTAVSGKIINGSSVLRSGDQIVLADRVRLGFRIPSPLSSSAVLDFESDHRPPHSVDGIILMAEHCLLGPRSDHHIRCEEWQDMVVLYSQQGELRCRSNMPLRLDGNVIRDSAALTDGAVISGEDLRFRVEQIG